MGSPESPTHFIEVTASFYGVGFLDEHLREYMSYAFKVEGEGRLFLLSATHREFEGDTDTVVNGTNYLFSTTGHVAIQRVTFRPEHTKETADARADLTGNYEQVPQFGSYDGLLQRERLAGA